MATQAQMDRLVGKALFDGDFRKRLIDDPEGAARSLRYRLDPAQAARIRSLNPAELTQLAAAFVDAADLNDHPGIGFW
jgi:hypothetical protein